MAITKTITLVDGKVFTSSNISESVNNDGVSSLRFQIIDFDLEPANLYVLFSQDNCATIVVTINNTEEDTTSTYTIKGYTKLNSITKNYDNQVLIVNLSKATNENEDEESTK